jgi:hypothetical protein
LADGPIQHAAHGRRSSWPEGAGQRVAAGPARGKDLAGRISGPFADRGQRLGAGQHRADRDAEHADQRVPSAASLAGSASWARSSSRLRHWSLHSAAGAAACAAAGMGMMSRQARRPSLVMGFDTHLIAGGRACAAFTGSLTRPSRTSQARTLPRPCLDP